ncbi:MAG: HD domain-containing protein [Candidatus Promineofilum sp.]|nr:HD domain-containing protein [Promineifilum sp.]
MSADYEQAKAYALGRLAGELSPHLTYHSLRHTRDDVLPAAVRLARATGVDGDALLCLATAALFHDIGFLVTYDDHETHGIALAQAALPDLGYSAAQLDVIAELIAATRMPQRPTSPLAELLCDADLDVLGREDFWDVNRLLLAETEYYRGQVISEAEWLVNQLRFLEEHVYFSGTAHTLRDPGKVRNVDLMRRVLYGLNGSSAHLR